MYARTVGKRGLNFQVSGMLWQRSLVMRDLETGSLWSHLLGKAMRGDLEGTELKLLPAVITTWKEWRTRHPKTTVLGMSRTDRTYDAGVWKKPERHVYGVHLGAGRPSPAVAITKLMREGVVNVEAEGKKVVVTYASDGQRTQAFESSLEEITYRFQGAGKGRMSDLETRSIWDVVTGECVAGRLKGKKLSPQPGTLSYRKAWEAFFPEGKIVE